MDWMLILWVVLALVIACVVMATGLLDLIWLAAAALVAAAARWMLPDHLATPVMLLIVFALSAVGLVIAGRFIRMPQPPDTGLNQRAARLIGEAGTAVDDFTLGRGRINICDAQWTAKAADDTRTIARGDVVRVIAADGLTLIVAPPD